MGDIILTTPALKILKETYPQATIDYLVYEKFGNVIATNKQITKLIPFPKIKILSFLKRIRFIKLFLLLKQFFQELRKSKYDLIVDLHNTTDSSLLSLLAKGKRRVGHKKQLLNLWYHKRSKFCEKNELTKIHGSLINLFFLRDAGLIELKTDLVDNILIPNLELPLESLSFADSFYKKNNLLSGYVLGINPCASYDFKRWSEQGFATLADKLLLKIGGSLLLFAGPGEEAIVQRVVGQMKQPVIVVSGFGLVDVIAIISKLSLFVTNDSGLMHAATAFSVPLVALFGSTNFLKFAPLGLNSRSVCSRVALHHKKLKWLKKKTPGELFPGVGLNEIFSAVNSFNI